MVSTQFLYTLVATAAVATAASDETVRFMDDNQLDARANTHHNLMLIGAEGSMNNYREQMDKLNEQIRAHPEHAGAAIATTAIQSADSQIDNAIATVAHVLAPFTGGISLAIGNFLLGPFVQSVTDGAEVFLGNVIGGAVDAISYPIAQRLSKSYTRLIHQANQYNINTNRLVHLNSQLTARLARGH